MGELRGLLHDDEVPVDVALVERLIAAQFPRWSDLAVTPVEVRGTVNAVFRLGSQLTVRLPIRRADPDEVRAWLAREAAAAVELAAASPVPTPAPVAMGRPGCGYPMPWAVQTWIPGSHAGQTAAESTEFAADLAGFIAALRTVDTRGRRHRGLRRGGVLASHEAWVQECLHRSTGLLDVAAAAALWAQLRELPPPAQQVMAHGDLVPGNVLVDADNRLCGVIDGGGFGPADPALELVGAWHLLEDGPRSALRRTLGCGDQEWSRGMAWALQQSLGLVWYYRDSHPDLADIGQQTIHRILHRN
jgi:aminoglycoside phosphotransferase (APT) family kinase protein